MAQIWLDYSSGATNTALQYNATDALLLPVMTFCPKVPSRSPLDDLREEQFAANAFALEDIFENETVTTIKMTRLYAVSEVSANKTPSAESKYVYKSL